LFELPSILLLRKLEGTWLFDEVEDAVEVADPVEVELALVVAVVGEVEVEAFAVAVESDVADEALVELEEAEDDAFVAAEDDEAVFDAAVVVAVVVVALEADPAVDEFGWAVLDEESQLELDDALAVDVEVDATFTVLDVLAALDVLVFDAAEAELAPAEELEEFAASIELVFEEEEEDEEAVVLDVVLDVDVLAEELEELEVDVAEADVSTALPDVVAVVAVDVLELEAASDAAVAVVDEVVWLAAVCPCPLADPNVNPVVSRVM
jgi:hypothetical protein